MINSLLHQQLKRGIIKVVFAEFLDLLADCHIYTFNNINKNSFKSEIIISETKK
jgi:hypothetical protein